MSEWTDGYRQALADIAHLAHSRGLVTTPALEALLADVVADALVIEREQDLRRRRLRATHEAMLPLEGEAP
jgi:hypothetical protein